ncbi:MAG: hypothetical protein JW910_00925, partial [Anaerolineae bacterium]|nr:hypothetical protein [Anaerolineae bacterium]
HVAPLEIPAAAHYLFEANNWTAIAPDGATFAFARDALYLYQDGALQVQPGTEAPEGALYDAVVWGAVQWMLPVGTVDYTCDPALPPRLTVDGAGRVLPGGPNNLRDSVGGALTGQIPAGGSFLVLDGPVCDEGVAWWQVGFEGNPDLFGWTVEGVGGDYFVEPVLP